MSLFSDNIRHLRLQKGLSQNQLAEKLIITRVRLAKYEEGKNEPPIELLKRISRFFHISIDILISVNLKEVSMEQLLKMDDNRILLPITVNREGGDCIEIITHKAKAGYLNGYSDPEYIEQLDHITLPFLSSGKYRAFPIEGDSMPPHRDGSFVVGRYVENLSDIRDGKTYVLLTRNEGIVYKRMYRKGKKESVFILLSDNAFYKPYEIRAGEILEAWEYACSFATKEYEKDELHPENIRDMFKQLRQEISAVKEAMR